MCCRSGWEIPVEARAYARIRAGLAGDLSLARTAARDRALEELLPPTSVPFDDAIARLGQDASGACLFLERPANLCALHRQLGPQVLASACRQFPRLCVLTPRGVSVTLSHYCPTVARGCFERSAALRVVRNPAAIPTNAGYEGLDARLALPPLLRPDALMCWESYAEWERHAVSLFARDDLSPAQALELLAGSAVVARAWGPAQGPFREHLQHRVLGSSDAPTSLFRATRPACEAVLRLYRGVRDRAPEPLRQQVPHGDLSGNSEWVEARWRGFAAPVRRYLAARAFASWVAYQGQGLLSVVFSLVASLAVLRVEATRRCREQKRLLDESILLEAMRGADLLLVHLADPQALADWLAQAEELDLDELLESVG